MCELSLDVFYSNTTISEAPIYYIGAMLRILFSYRWGYCSSYFRAGWSYLDFQSSNTSSTLTLYHKKLSENNYMTSVTLRSDEAWQRCRTQRPLSTGCETAAHSILCTPIQFQNNDGKYKLQIFFTSIWLSFSVLKNLVCNFSVPGSLTPQDSFFHPYNQALYLICYS